MRHRKKILGAVFLLGLSFSLSAQQDMLLTQEYFSRVNRNPAATGNSNDIDIFLHGRIQWVGVDNG
ncbi:MAG: type IX secretion system membrane protein PorP/SprF, partial [Paludibacteraceae bacterium]|nr:type IX secretion system membrane protein PorP/SprF [Paludibacteraceae bacterium]